MTMQDPEATVFLTPSGPALPESPFEQCIHQIFEAVVERAPHRVAASFGGEEITYFELNQRSNRLAFFLRSRGVGPDVPVGLCMERSLHLVVGMLGILKAGGAYVPLDPSYPKDRLAFMLGDTEVAVVVTVSSLVRRLPDTPAQLVCLDDLEEVLETQSPENPSPRCTPDNLANVFYTSGSTGAPKGVSVVHRGVVRLARGTRCVAVTPRDVFLQRSPISFDAATLEVWCTLLNGAKLVVMPPGYISLAELGAIVRQERVTILALVTPLFHLVADGHLGVIEGVRQLIVGGDVVSAKLVRRAYEALPDCRIVNAYGPTENTSTTTCYPIETPPSEHATVPIGQPIEGTEVYVLDAGMRPVPVGVTGELYTGGAGLARDYWRRPALTAERFIQSPFGPGRLFKTGDRARWAPDGNLEFLGRIDAQVKIRGIRLELGEVEATLREHPGVRDTVVTVQDEPLGDKRLIAYIVRGSEPPVSPRELRRFLEEKLPEQGIPSAFVMLEALPLGPNGKVDRRALPPHAVTCSPETSGRAPRTATEVSIADAFRQVLGTDRVDPDAGFFDLGGSSLSAVRLAARLSDAFQVDIPARLILEAPTLSDLIIAVQRRIEGCPPAEIHARGGGDLNAQAKLDPAISPGAARPTRLPSEAKSIFLTGATGFLGAYLLRALLVKTQATVYCLVRSTRVEEGGRRIAENLAHYGLWDEAMRSRIVAVPGDLARPLLGMQRRSFDEVARTIDVIYHNGADTNFVYPYRMLEAPNVRGTEEILRLACLGGRTPVHYVSTLSTLVSTSNFGKTIYEHDLLDHGDGLWFGYAESKWVAEKLVGTARERGLPVCVYRLENVIGDTKSGCWNTMDMVCRLIKGCVQMGLAPELLWDVHMVPVDHTADAIVHASNRPGLMSETFHVQNPRGLPFGRIFEWLQDRGYSIDVVDYRTWTDAVVELPRRAPDNVLVPLVPLFAERRSEHGLTIPEFYFMGRIPVFDQTNWHRALDGSGLACPEIDRTLFDRYIDEFTSCGFLPAP